LWPDIEKLPELVHQKENPEPPYPFMQSLSCSPWLRVSKYAARTKAISNGYGAQTDWNRILNAAEKIISREKGSY